MPCYLASGLSLESEAPLPELPQAVQPPLCRVQCRQDGWPSFEPIHQVADASGQAYLALGRLSTGYRVHFPGQADFELLDDGSAAWYRLAAGADPALYPALLLKHVLPLLLTLRGELVLHAGGVVGPIGAVLFVGASGCGKSTLTAGLGQLGWDVLGDDSLVLREQGDGWQVLPGVPAIHLRADVAPVLASSSSDGGPLHAGRRRLLPASGGPIAFAARPAMVKKIYFLTTPGAVVSIKPMRPPAALLELLKNVFPLGPGDHHAASRFQRLARLASGSSLGWLSYPHALQMLPEVGQAVLADLQLATLHTG